MTNLTFSSLVSPISFSFVSFLSLCFFCNVVVQTSTKICIFGKYGKFDDDPLFGKSEQ